MQKHIWAINCPAAGLGTNSLGVMVSDTAWHPVPADHILPVQGEYGKLQKHQPFLSQCTSLPITLLLLQNTFRARSEQGTKCQVTAPPEELKRHWSEISLCHRVGISSQSHLALIFNMVCAFLDRRHITNRHQHWNLDACMGSLSSQEELQMQEPWECPLPQQEQHSNTEAGLWVSSR